MVTRILIIDEGSYASEALKLVLEQSDFEVVTISSLNDSIQADCLMSSDIIILDMVAPEMKDMAVCKTLREMTRAPILVLSPFNKPNMVAKALDNGADDFLPKPVPASILIAHIHKLARRDHAERQASRDRPSK